MYKVLLTLTKADIKRQRHEIQTKHFDETGQKLLNHLKEKEKRDHWGRRSWVFQFNKTTFFITTFAPFYPDHNSRFSFGNCDCYLLFQPELSFALHDLPDDSAITNWDHPKNVRDRIRLAYRNAGRQYDPPMMLNEPMIYDIVKRVHPTDDIYKWWTWD